uniref:CNNM transmembrane domain-containing protein n=1 Tax=Globisporangium ultimum (strain ATCC 200006 / CBS 805.95 / DAOM BR144) TaxID=431595 RepID=K3XCC3_GLOUD
MRAHALVLLVLLSCAHAAAQDAEPRESPSPPPPSSSPHTALKVSALVVLLLLSAMFSGLGLGLMSLDLIGLEIVVAAGDDAGATDKEKRNGAAARRIIPLRQQGNLLLTTLLLGNVAVNSLTSILMADLTSGIYGFLGSTALIVVFGEILPQALCTKYALGTCQVYYYLCSIGRLFLRMLMDPCCVSNHPVIGGAVTPFVRVLIAVFYVFAKPVSLVLDAYLGEDIGTVFTKRQLTEMIAIHETQQMIDSDESGILRGAMTFRSKTAAAIMTPVDQVFMLPLSATLGPQTIHDVLTSGFSRILIYDTSRDDVVGTIHVKDLVFVDPKEHVMLSSFVHIFGRNVHHVAPTCGLDSLLHTFKSGSTHLVLIKQVQYSDDNEVFEQLVGIVTLEDVLEEILQDEILDEGDIPETHEKAQRKHRLSRLYADSGRLSLADICRSEGHIDDIEALASHLQETHPVFRATNTRGVSINASRLAQFLSKCPIVEFGSTRVHMPCKQASAGDGSGGSGAAITTGDAGEESEQLVRKNAVTRYCIVLLQGRLLVDYGDGTKPHEVGPWSVFAGDSLVVQDGLYAADCTVETLPSVVARCVRIDRSEFQQTLLHPLPRRDSAASVHPLDEGREPSASLPPLNVKATRASKPSGSASQTLEKLFNIV